MLVHLTDVLWRSTARLGVALREDVEYRRPG
jgi:hypothetical protein